MINRGNTKEFIGFEHIQDTYKIKFNLDPCATKINHKCKDYFTIDDDGLKQSWKGKKVFMNPPFSDTAGWLEKAYQESRHFNTTVIALIPGRTCTNYLHKWLFPHAHVDFFNCRVGFINSETNKEDREAPMDLIIAVFKRFSIKYRGRLNVFDAKSAKEKHKAEQKRTREFNKRMERIPAMMSGGKK